MAKIVSYHEITTLIFSWGSQSFKHSEYVRLNKRIWTRTCMIDGEMPLPGCLSEPHERGRSVHCTDTYTVLGRRLTQRIFHRGSSTSSCATEATTIMMISSSHPHDDCIIASQLMDVDAPRGCERKETPATVKYRHDEFHKTPRYQHGLNCFTWTCFAGFYLMNWLRNSDDPCSCSSLIVVIGSICL